MAELKIDDPETGMQECQQMLCNLANRSCGTELSLQTAPRPTATEDFEDELQQSWDDVSGRDLDANKARKARAEQVEYIHKTNLYTKVPRSKATSPRAKVISVRRIDINKGDAILDSYRSRFAAREIKKDDRPDLFAATPPLEALKATLSVCAGGNRGEKIMVNDVSRAYYSAPARRQGVVELPEEDKVAGEQTIGEINPSMYGTRDAAQNWGEKCAPTVTNMGLAQSKASPCTFNHHQRRLKCHIHGDDFVTVGVDANLKWMKRELEKTSEIKTQVLGPGKEDPQEVRVWTPGTPKL